MSNTTCSRAGLWFWKARIKPKLPGRAQILLCQPSMPLMKQIWSHADTFMWSEGNPESTERWIETLMVFGLFMGFVGIKKTTDCQQTFIWKDAEKEEEEQGMKIIRSVFSLDMSPRMKRKEWKVRKYFFLSSDPGFNSCSGECGFVFDFWCTVTCRQTTDRSSVLNSSSNLCVCKGLN